MNERIVFLYNYLERIELQFESLHGNYLRMSKMISTLKPSVWNHLSFLLKNKLGMTKDQAKDLFYQSKSKGKQEGGEDPEHPESVEEKMNVIMGYMKDTSEKLETIERDIAHLKQQVEIILKKL